jgi:hypothetical protein
MSLGAFSSIPMAQVDLAASPVSSCRYTSTNWSTLLQLNGLHLDRDTNLPHVPERGIPLPGGPILADHMYENRVNNLYVVVHLRLAPFHLVE